jgi:hypothetical protein
MGRVWAIAGAIVAATTVVFLLQDFVGAGTLLTMALCIGGGAAAAYLPGRAYLSRGIWLFVGVVIGALGFVLGASAFPDTNVGLYLGGIVPVILLALLTMFTKRQSNFLAGVIGSGAMAGVYANVFNLDPQAINVSAPIAIGQTVLPLGMGYLAGMLIILFVKTDAEWETEAAVDKPVEPEADQGETPAADEREAAR